MTAARCSGADAALRARVVDEARRWIGTPYVHQASCLGAGADCLGLVRGVWRAVVGAEPEAAGPYSADWAEATGEERLLAAAGRHLVRLPLDDAGPGDVLLFRMRDGAAAKHVGILATEGLNPGRIIHAYSRHAVAETSLTDAWVRRIAGAFRFPAGRN